MQFPPSPFSAYHFYMKRALILVVLLACRRTTRNDLPPEAWGVSDYAAAGITIDKQWDAADHLNAAQVLKEVTAGHRERLPRYNGAKSGAVFQKLLDDLPNQELPAGKWFDALNARLDFTGQIATLYSPNLWAAQTREWIELMGVELREGAVLVRRMDEVLQSLDPNDPSSEQRTKGFAQMKRGCGQMLVGLIAMASDDRLREADRIAVVKHVTVALPALFAVIPPEMQTQFRDEVTKLLGKLPNGAVRDAVIEAQHGLP
jgi:hypothetical protein